MGLVGWFYGVEHHFQQYFSYIVAVNYIRGGNRSAWRKPQACQKSLTNFIIMLYTLPWVGFKLTLVVIGTNFIGSCKYNYHTITTMTYPNNYGKSLTFLHSKKNMEDVNQQDRLPNITLINKLKVKEQRFYCYSTFHSHSSVFKNEHNSSSKMCVKQPLACSWVALFTSAENAIYGHLYSKK